MFLHRSDGSPCDATEAVDGVCLAHDRRVVVQANLGERVNAMMAPLTAAINKVSGNTSQARADRIIEEAIREVVAAIRLGRRIDREVPTGALDQRLQVAAREYAEAVSA